MSAPLTDGGEGRRTVAAEFPLAMDATRAALQITEKVAATDPAVRAVLCTIGVPLAGSELAQAVDLLQEARAGQVVASASTAVLVGPVLPPGVELVAASRTPGSRSRSERVYELRPSDTTASAAGDDLGDPGPDSAASNLAWARRAAARPVLGREEPSTALDDAWQATLRGNRRNVLLVGEGGIGKTAIAAEHALRARTAGALVLYGRWDREQISPYQAIREALGTYAAGCPTGQLRDQLEAHRDAISRLLPDIAARLGDRHAPPRGDPEGERLGLYDAVRTWLDRLAAQRPVLLVLDDLHWAERSSQLLVDHLRHATGTAPWMLLATLRDVEGDPPDTTSTQRIEVRGLDATAIAQLARRTLGSTLEPHDQAVEWLTTETAGNPLFVQHILRSLLPATNGYTALQTARNHLPEQLRDVIRWRLTQLPDPTRRLLTDAAVVGPTLDLDLIATAVSKPSIVLRNTLEPAVQEELLRLDPTTDHYHFTHEVVRRTLGDDAETQRTSHLHRQVAAALQARFAEGEDVQPTEIAYHYLRGADPDTAAAAVRWARLGAEAARRATGFDEAVQLLLQAVTVHDERGGHEDHQGHITLACELRLDLAEAHDRAGQFTARDERHAEAAAMARDLRRTDLFIQAALGFGGRLPAAPPPNPTARRLLEEALECSPSDDSRDRALVLARLAHVRHFDAPYDLRRDLSDRAVLMARRLDDPVALATVLTARCFALEGPDSVDEYLSVGDEVERIGEQVDDPDLRLQGIRLRVPALFTIGRHREARELAASHARLARQIRHQDHLRVATLWDILWTGLEGDGARAQARLDELARQLTEGGHAQGPFISFAYTFVLRWLHGELERTRPILDAFRAAEPDRTAWWAISIWLDAGTGHQDRALARLDQRDPEDVVGGIEHDFMWSPTMISLAVGASCGHPTWARMVHQALLPYAGRLWVTGYALFGGAIDHHIGTLALVLDRPEEAVHRLESALATHRALEAPPFVGLSARWLAHALAIRAAPGDHEQASALLEEADILADRFGLGGLPNLQDQAARNA